MVGDCDGGFGGVDDVGAGAGAWVCGTSPLYTVYANFRVSIAYTRQEIEL